MRFIPVWLGRIGEFAGARAGRLAKGEKDENENDPVAPAVVCSLRHA